MLTILVGGQDQNDYGSDADQQEDQRLRQSAEFEPDQEAETFPESTTEPTFDDIESDPFLADETAFQTNNAYAQTENFDTSNGLLRESAEIPSSKATDVSSEEAEALRVELEQVKRELAGKNARVMQLESGLSLAEAEKEAANAELEMLRNSAGGSSDAGYECLTSFFLVWLSHLYC